MSKSIKRVKGTRDLLPPETQLWAAVEAEAREIFGTYGYEEIRTPIIESTDLFVRTVGESTDIVGKEMYTFPDRRGRSLTLRPETTASVARAFLENRLNERPAPTKLFYMGPQFRYERPQEGRYRQFSQIGAELIGDGGPFSDAELLVMLTRFLEKLGFSHLRVQLNTLGDEVSRANYRQVIHAFFSEHSDQLGEDSQRRLETNPLRILDTKVPAERALVERAPRLKEHLSEESREHFACLCRLLDSFGVDYSLDETLVRGLDYYSHTVFEIVDEGLGAQNALCGGGRYDRLIRDLGGPEVPALGFAIGEDRLLAVLPESFRREHAAPPLALVAPLGTVEVEAGMRLAESLRELGISVVAEYRTQKFKSLFKKVDRLGCRFLLLLGEDEVAAGKVTVKDLHERSQVTLPQKDVAGLLNPIQNGVTS